MTALAIAYGMTLQDALDNWARWCRRVSDCFPDCPTNWELFEQVEYKNCHQTTQEKLEAALEHKEPDELDALRMERMVQSLDTPKRTAIRVHWVLMPESGRHELGLTREQWDERRSRFASRRSGWYFSPLLYREAVYAAMDALEAML